MITIYSMIILFFLITRGMASDIPLNNSAMKEDYDALIWGTTNLYSDYCELQVNFVKFITHHTDKYAIDCARVKVTILAKKEQVVVRSKISVGEKSLYSKPRADETFSIGSTFKQSFGDWRASNEPIKEYIYLRENEIICLFYDILIIDRNADKQNFVRHIATVEYSPSKTNLSSKVSSEILELIPETTAQAYCNIPRQ